MSKSESCGHQANDMIPLFLKNKFTIKDESRTTGPFKCSDSKPEYSFPKALITENKPLFLLKDNFTKMNTNIVTMSFVV